MKLEQTVSDASNAPPMRRRFRLLLSALALAERVTPEKFLPNLTADALIRWAKVPVAPGAVEGLRRLTASLAADTELTMFGRLSVHWDFLRLMRNAAKVERALAENPTLAAAPVTAPIFILGLPRSGTTFLHGLLAHDPDNLVPRVWQTLYPEPRRADFHPAGDRRVNIVNRQLNFFGGIAPEFSQLHPVDADGPQECSEITSHIFQSLRFDTTFRVPSYLRWVEATGHHDAFAFHKRFLQYLQAGVPARWVLKCPDHTFSLDAIAAVYPDARFVVVHRDPIAVLGSVAHLTEVLRKPFLSNIDPVEIGAQVGTRWIEGANLLLAFDRRPDIEPERKIHVHYEELIASPLVVIERIYNQFDLPLRAPAVAAISEAVFTRPRGGYGNHAPYSLETFKLSQQALQTQFAPYVSQYCR